MDENLKSLQYQIREQTEIPPHNQLILYRDQLLQSVIDELTQGKYYYTYEFSIEKRTIAYIIPCFRISGKNYPLTTEDDPLILIYKNNNTATSFSISLGPELDIPKFPVFPNVVSVEHDASQAKVK